MDQTSQKNKKESGQSLVEFAMSIMFLIILVAGVVDLGRAFFVYIALRDAAQEGAAYASVARIYPEGPMMCAEIVSRTKTTSDTQIVDLNQTTVTSTFDGIGCGGLDPENSASDRQRACFGRNIRVTVSIANFPLATPFMGTILGKQTIPISASIEDSVLTPHCLE